MKKNNIPLNAQTLQKEYDWFAEVLETRFKLYFNQSTEHKAIFDIPPPDLSRDPSVYAKIINHYKVSTAERLVLLLALIPHTRPQMLDLFFTKNALYDRGYTEFGGIMGTRHSGFLPTGETAMFLLCGHDLQSRFKYMSLFDDQHFFFKFNMIKLVSTRQDEPKLSSGLVISEEYLTHFTSGDTYKPHYSSNFPASLLETKQTWDDLVLDDFLFEEINEIVAWIKHHDTILNDWGLAGKIKRGYRTLFYGPPGTGKTMTATLIGQRMNMDVYRIDLSQVVSKYIGETEKNLANIFDQAEHKNWVLFFDEADALFGKRTSTSDSKDRHANQEIAYLLQRIEDFPGVVILATNLKGSVDEAFARRFQSMIYFAIPNARQRLLLWESAFSKKSVLAKDVDLEHIADSYELTGGAIINVLRYVSLAALQRNSNVIQLADIIQGIRKEMRKEGKTV